MSAISDDISARLAAFVATASPADLPAATLHDAKRAIPNNFAAGFGGCRDAAIDTIVAIEVDDAIPVEAARVALDGWDGRRRETYVSQARGSLGRPLTDAEVERKVVDQAALNAPTLVAKRLIETVWRLDQVADAAAAIRCASLA